MKRLTNAELTKLAHLVFAKRADFDTWKSTRDLCPVEQLEELDMLVKVLAQANKEAVRAGR